MTSNKQILGYLVGIDGGLENMGIALVEVDLTDGVVGFKAHSGKVFHTRKSTKAHKIYETDDLVRRLHEIGDYLESVLKDYPVIAVGMEDFSSINRNAKVSANLQAIFGLVVELLRQKNIALVRESPKDIKKKLTGSETAEKEEVQAAIEKIFNLKKDFWTMKPALINHAADALAAAYCCKESEIFKLSLTLGNRLANTDGRV